MFLGWNVMNDGQLMVKMLLISLVYFVLQLVV